MKNADKIKKMFVHVEFECYGRTAFIDVEINTDDILSIGARSFMDEKIGEFLKAHHPLTSPAIKH